MSRNVFTGAERSRTGRSRRTDFRPGQHAAAAHKPFLTMGSDGTESRAAADRTGSQSKSSGPGKANASYSDVWTWIEA